MEVSGQSVVNGPPLDAAAGRPKKKGNLEPFNIRRRINEREKDTAATTRGEDEPFFA
jgi:hypothetical protein